MAVRYIAYNSQGERISGRLEVESLETAEQLLWRSDLTVVSLKKERRLPSIQELMPTFFRPKPQELVSFTRDLATLLQSGIRLLPAIGVLLPRVRAALFKKALRQVEQDIRTGVSFSEACSKHTNIFPAIYSRLLTVGEETGRLELMLNQAADYMEKQAALASKLKRAMTYPALVSGVGLVAAIILVGWALPGMSGLFGEFGTEQPWSARVLLSLSVWGGNHGWQLAVGIFAVVVGAFLYFRTRSGRRRLDYLSLKLPVVKNIVRSNSMSRFSDTMATLMAAGLPLTEVMDLMLRTAPNAPVYDAMLQVRTDLLTGEPLSQAISKQSLFPPLVPQMVAVGEESGTLEQNLGTLTRFYEKEADEAVSSLTRMFEPAIIIVVGLVIGFIAVTLISSMYGVMGEIE